jgi:hypothetical protein
MGLVMFRQGIWEALPFVVSVLVLSMIIGWIAWNALEFLTADTTVLVKLKKP